MSQQKENTFITFVVAVNKYPKKGNKNMFWSISLGSTICCGEESMKEQLCGDGGCMMLTEAGPGSRGEDGKQGQTLTSKGPYPVTLHCQPGTMVQRFHSPLQNIPAKDQRFKHRNLSSSCHIQTIQGGETESCVQSTTYQHRLDMSQKLGQGTQNLPSV